RPGGAVALHGEGVRVAGTDGGQRREVRDADRRRLWIVGRPVAQLAVVPVAPGFSGSRGGHAVREAGTATRIDHAREPRRLYRAGPRRNRGAVADAAVRVVAPRP